MSKPQIHKMNKMQPAVSTFPSVSEIVQVNHTLKVLLLRNIFAIAEIEESLFKFTQTLELQ